MRSYLFIGIIAVLIVLIGISTIYSSTYQKEMRLWQLQIWWAGLGLICFLFMAHFNYRRLWDWTYFLYFLALALLSVVFLIGLIRMGAQRWLKIAWFNFQPSELSKFVIILVLARYFSTKSLSDLSLPVRRLGFIRSLIVPFMLIVVPMGLIIEQPDLGSGLLVLFTFVVMLFLAGVRARFLLLILGGMLLSMPIFWHFLHGYQRERLLVFLNPNIDPLGAGYTLIQSKIAIGSGGLLGKGWLAGTQSQLRFLPESHTDFIFSTFTEEWGAGGALVLTFLYGVLIREGFLIAERTNDHFGKLLASGITWLFASQVIINIAMTMGLMPVVGIPLPLMSYGGSSLIVTFIVLGILVNIDRQRTPF
jgi:rod shape determining protein RodA